jgi:light-regulated signal transduction histidine kinase (bacteriophytochrome)
LIFVYILFDNKKEIIANNKSLLALTNRLHESNYELSEINAIASHDLRSPANSIKSLIELIYLDYQEKYKNDADFFELIEMIKLSNERMLSVVNDVMDYTMIGSERKMSQVDVHTLISDIKVDLKDLLDKNKATIILNQKLPLIDVYSTEFRLLMQNLINNGIKFHKKGINPTIEISYSEDADFYHFVIADNGIGIPTNNLENVFKMFKRGSNSSEFAGTGVGLSHCKKIVSQHKGTIWIESEVNIGTQVNFTIAKDLS